jgi:formylglycine-generating enzyme required for sulfatase activity
MNQLDQFPHLSSYVSSLKVIPDGKFRYGQRGWSTQMSSFKMGATPVTWALWKEYCNSTGFQLHDETNQSHLDNHPALVSWLDIMGKAGFTTWASEVSGVLLSLPTSTQFEYAARGGQDGLKYPWGDRFDRRLVWWSADIESAKTTGAVDRLDKIYCNGYGLTDMVGNVPQWCRDRVRTVTTRSIDPVGSETSPDRDIRGAMIVIPNKYTYFQCAFTEHAFIDVRWLNIGFRLAAPANEVHSSNFEATKL